MTELDDVVEEFAFGLEESSAKVQLGGYVDVLVDGEGECVGGDCIGVVRY